MSIPYGLVKELPDTPYSDAITRVTAELKEVGFGILTEIDVKKAMHEKLGKDFRPYVILGACKPPLAYQALSAEAHIGLLLPCNVVVQEREGGGSIVSAFSPKAGFSIVERKDLEPLAAEVESILEGVLAKL